MDLKTVSLHWWEFMALLESLPENATIKQVMGLRGMDLSEIEDPKTREGYAKRKALVALDPPNEKDELEEVYGKIK